MTTTYDLAALDHAAEEVAVLELENTPFWPAVVEMARLNVPSDEVKRQVLRRLPGYEATAVKVALAVAWVKREGR